jgi:hypothetical protein
MKPLLELDPLLRFYRLEGQDARGRTLPDIWDWDDARLEAVHDYIQWLFPLPEPSAFNPYAPVLDATAIAAFHESPHLRQRLLRSLERLLAFYGLTMAAAPHQPGVRIARAASFGDRSRVWLRAGNHNHLRLTRILTSLRLLGLEEHAAALADCLEAIAREHPHAISATTLAYWQRAATP